MGINVFWSFCMQTEVIYHTDFEQMTRCVPLFTKNKSRKRES